MRTSVPVRYINPTWQHQENELSFEKICKPGGFGFLTGNLKITPCVFPALCDNRVRDLGLILVIFRDRNDVPARKLPLKVLLFKVCVRLNHIQQRYILEYFF